VHPASPRRRRLFDPIHGWFRTFDRAANHWLSHYFFAHVPGIHAVYTLQLDRHLTVSEGEIAVRGLPEQFRGVRVLLVTDLHTGPFLAPVALARVFRRLMRLTPDLILVGGDVATTRIEDLDRFEPALRMLRAPLGVFGVLGNHDHYTGDAAGVARFLEGAGVRMLMNRAVTLERGGATVQLAGIDDLNAGAPDLDAALAGPPLLLLSHNPDVFFVAALRGVRLVFSGHTHGGQVRIPGLPVLVRMSRFRLDEGHYATGDAQLVVSRGLGVSGIPLRVACPPEAMLLTLEPASRP
jgi:predicted MPP superfamily phosphohydrolase